MEKQTENLINTKRLVTVEYGFVYHKHVYVYVYSRSGIITVQAGETDYK